MQFGPDFGQTLDAVGIATGSSSVDVSVISGAFFMGLFYFLVLIFAVHAIIVAYHWYHYGTNRVTIAIATAIYLGGASILFLVMIGLLQII